MKIVKNKHSNRHFAVIAISSVVLAAIIAGGVYAYHFTTQPATKTATPSSSEDSNINYDKPTDEQQQAGNEAKERAVNENNPPTASDISITSANQTEGILRIRTTISTIDELGTCTLLMTMAGASDITMTAGAQVLGSYSVCKGFDLPTSDIKKGTWQAKVTYSSEGKTSTATQQIEVK